VTEPLVTPTPDDRVEPIDPEAELARRNLVLGWLLFGLFVLLFFGTIGVALVYLSIAD
jgi:hypothetical protein